MTVQIQKLPCDGEGWQRAKSWSNRRKHRLALKCRDTAWRNLQVLRDGVTAIPCMNQELRKTTHYSITCQVKSQILKQEKIKTQNQRCILYDQRQEFQAWHQHCGWAAPPLRGTSLVTTAHPSAKLPASGAARSRRPPGRRGWACPGGSRRSRGRGSVNGHPPRQKHGLLSARERGFSPTICKRAGFSFTRIAQTPVLAWVILSGHFFQSTVTRCIFQYNV